MHHQKKLQRKGAEEGEESRLVLMVLYLTDATFLLRSGCGHIGWGFPGEERYVDVVVVRDRRMGEFQTFAGGSHSKGMTKKVVNPPAKSPWLKRSM